MYVYPLQENLSGRVSYLPYDTALSKSTLARLASYADQALDYAAAARLVDEVHTAADEQMLLGLELGRVMCREQMRRTLFGVVSWRDVREQLIRRSSGMRFMLWGKALGDERDTFSIPRSLLVGMMLKGVQVLWRQGNDGIAEWRVVRRATDFERGALFALPDGYARYSPTLGLNLTRQGGYACRWQPRSRQGG